MLILFYILYIFTAHIKDDDFEELQNIEKNITVGAERLITEKVREKPELISVYIKQDKL